MKNQDFSNLSAVFVNCTLKKSPEISHTDSLIAISKQIMSNENVKVDEIRLVDHEVANGVYPDMKDHNWEKDEWPLLFKLIF
jgi:Holliday junction resolvasome RuvABC ATP-dependent DNA helicase subunit